MSERIKCPCGATNPPGEDCTGLFHDSWAYVERLRTLRRLARNLRDAALANYAWRIGNEVGVDDGWTSCAIMRGDEPDAPDGGCRWVPNLMGAAAPGWER